jgi:hypothetical protein
MIKFELPKNQNDFVELEGLFSMHGILLGGDKKPANQLVIDKICNKINEIIESCTEKPDENKMRIYEIQINNEKVWVSAKNPLDALKEEHNVSDMMLSDYDGIVEIPESEWGECKVLMNEFVWIDEEGTIEPETKFKPIHKTFREWMDENGGDSDIIATTVY